MELAQLAIKKNWNAQSEKKQNKTKQKNMYHYIDSLMQCRHNGDNFYKAVHTKVSGLALWDLVELIIIALSININIEF